MFFLQYFGDNRRYRSYKFATQTLLVLNMYLLDCNRIPHMGIYKKSTKDLKPESRLPSYITKAIDTSSDIDCFTSFT